MQPPSRPSSTLVLLAALLAVASTRAVADEIVDEPRRDTTGFYPIWESTGHVEQAGAVRLGSTGAQVGIAGRVHVGVQPLQYILRSPNGYLSVALPSPKGWNLSARIGAVLLLDGASRATFSPMYSSRLDNVGFGVTLVPISLSASTEPASWLEIHQTLTGLGVYAPGQLRTRVTPGYSVVADISPRSRHGLSLHVAEVGFWAHDLAIAGAAYRYRNSWLELRAGYFYRLTSSGVQASPLAALAVLL